MRSILLQTFRFIFFALPVLLAVPASAQINYTQNFSASAAGWTGAFWYTGATACGGSGGAIQYNLYSSAPSTNIVSPSLGTSIAGNVTLSFDYKIANWSANNVGTSGNWGTINVQYSTTASGPWTTAGTIDQSNHTVSASCATKTYAFVSPGAGPLYVRLNATWTSGDYYLNLDNVTVTETGGVACSGTPNIAEAMAPSAVCPNNAFMLTATGATAASGITYQWEQFNNATSVWDPIPNATTLSYSVSGITSATDYRLITTCTNGGGQTISNTVSVGVNSFLSCYCAPPSTILHSFINDYMSNASITGTTLNSSNATNASNGYTLVSPSAPNNTASLTQGAAYTFVGTLTTGITQAAIWIDWDQSGTFSAAEYIPLSGLSGTTTATINVPLTAVPGQTGMRVRLRGGTFTANDACGAFGSGETEDFTITIDPALPCSGTPNPVTASGPAGVCPNANFTLVAGGYSTGLDLTYQWEVFNSATSTWDAIANATTPSYTVTGGIAAAADYRFVTTCANGGGQDISNTVTVGINPFYACYCGPNTGVTLNSVTGTNYITNVTVAPGTLNNTTTTTTGNSYNLFYPSTGTNTGDLEQGVSYTISTSHLFTGYFCEAWIDYNHSGTFDASEHMLLATNNLTGTASFTVPMTATPGQTGMRVRLYWTGIGAANACAAFNSYETEDYVVNIVPAPTCSGAPNVATASGPAGACANQPFTLNASGYSTGLGISYQWEVFNPSASTWDAIANATSHSYTVAGGITAPADYRFVTTCANGGGQDISNTVSMPMNTFLYCYCIPTYANGGSTDNITNVQLETLNNNSTAYGNPAPYYVDYTTQQPATLPIPGLTQGVSYNISITFGTHSTQYSGVWVDFDQSGTFEPSEYFSTGSSGGSNATVVIPIAVPISATPGLTRLRVRGGEDAALNATVPCGPSTNVWGEAEDYLIDVIPTISCSGTPAVVTASGPSAMCAGISFTLNATGATVAAGISYQWEEFNTATSTWGGITGATNTTLTVSGITAPTDYRFVTTCTNGGGQDISNTVSIALNAPSACYCIPTVTNGCTDGDVIARVKLHTLDNNSGTGCPSGTLGYSDYTSNTALTTTLLPSATYSCQVWAGQWTANYAVWIDYNDDGMFSATERVGYTTSPVTGSGAVGVLGSSASFPIVLSCTPPAGTHRMRVREVYNMPGINIDPCASTDPISGNYSFGEIEDYMITIDAPPACPAGGLLSASNVTSNSADLSWTLNCATATAWDFEYGPAGFTLGTGTMLTNVAAGTSYTLGGLSSATAYDVYYRANCGSSVSPWSVAVSFTTTIAPCAGQPNAVTASGPATVCSGVAFTLNATGATVAVGINYQWEMFNSAAGTWDPIAGATNTSHTTTVTAPTDFRFVTTCTTSGGEDSSNTVSVGMSSASLCYCAPPATVLHNFINDYMSNATITGTTLNSSNATNLANGYTNIPPTPASNTADLTQGVSYSFVGTLTSGITQSAIWIDWDHSGTFDASEYILMSGTSGTTTATIAVPLTAIPGQTGMRVRLRGGPFAAGDACGAFGSGETEDYIINVIQLTGCSGTPAAVTASGPSSVCSGVPFTLTAAGATIGSGITYQWEQYDAASSTWMAVTNGTNNTYSASIATATDFRFVTTCANGGGQNISNTVSVTMNAPLGCYCIPSYTDDCSFDDDLNTFTLNGDNGTGFNDVNTGCSPGGYDDRTAQPAVQLTAGNTYSGTVNTTYAFGNEHMRVWIDFGDDGIFDAADTVGFVSNFATTLVPFSITLPSTATPGTHRMRARVAYNTVAYQMDPCNNYGFGETHDYMVTVTTPTACTPAVTGINAPSVTMCLNDTLTLSAIGANTGIGVTYQWESSPAGGTSWGPIMGATNLTYTITGLTATTDYRFIVSCGTTSAMTVPVTISPAPASQCYCIPTYEEGCDEGDEINTFTLAGDNGTAFNDVNTGCAANAYDDRTAQPAVQLTAGNTYSGSINSSYAFGNEHAKIWIDFGDDGVFDAADAVASVSNFGTTLVPYTFTLPVTTAGGTHRMRVRLSYNTAVATMDPCLEYEYGETHDYMVSVTPAVLCGGTPSAGTLSAPSATLCASNSMTMTVSGATVGTGISYQWESSPAGGAAWAPINGATATSYTIPTGFATATDYRFRVDCAPAATFATTAIVTVSPASPITCYCIPTYTNGCGDDDDINTLILAGENGTGINDVNTGCSANAYDDRTAQPAISLAKGGSYSGQINSNYTSFENMKVWIDFGDDGVFDAADSVGSMGTFGTALAPFTINVPTGANTGLHRMRVRVAYNIPAGTISPCANYGYGETHDYMANIIPQCPAPSVTVSASANPACTGTAVTFTSSVTNGGATPSYQWMVNGTAVTGQTNAMYTSVSLNSGDVVSVSVMGACIGTGAAVSPGITMSVGSAATPTVSLAASANNVCAGTSVTFTATSTDGGTNPTYQWMVNSSPITGATDVVYSTSALNNGDQVSVMMTSNAACVSSATATSNTVVMMVNPMETPTIAISGSNTICAGTQATFTATTSGQGTLMWVLNGLGVATGNTFSSSTLNNGDYLYAVLFSTSQCTTAPYAESNWIVMNVNSSATPSVAVNASANMVCSGGTTTLVATPAYGGSSPAYQWYVNGNTITGATGSSYTASGITTNANYSVMMTSSEACATTPTAMSNSTPIGVYPSAAAITASGPTTICTSGGSVTLTAGAGTSYLWSNGATGQSITTSTPDIYSVTVTSVNGCIDQSQPVAVTQKAMPGTAKIKVVGPTSVCAPNSVAFVLDMPLGSTTGFAYQWYTGTTAIAGATDSTFSADASGSYHVVISGGGTCSKTSAAKTATVKPTPTAEFTSTGNTEFCAGAGSVITTATAAGTGATYTWLRNGNINAGSGATKTWTVAGDYSLVVTVNGCRDTSDNSVLVTVHPAPPTPKIVIVGPSSVCAPGTVSLKLDPTVSSMGSSFQWNVGGTAITGAEDSTHDADVTGNYTLTLITNQGCSKTSTGKTATVKPVPTAEFTTTTTTGSTEFCAGAGSVTMAAALAGTGATYMWLNNGTINAGSGATKTFTTSGDYSLVVTMNGCRDTSDYSEQVTVHPAPPTPKIVIVGPSSVCAPGTVSLKLDPTVSSMGSSFQWNMGGAAITGAEDSTYEADATGSYTLTLITNQGCTKTSTGKTATVKPLPVADFTVGGPTEFCQGGQVTFTAIPAGTGATYMWLKNGTINAGAGTSKNFNASGDYSMVATVGGCRDTTDYFETVTVNSLPVATVSTSDPVSFCEGGSATLNASPTGTGYMYAWYKTNVLDASQTSEDYIATTSGSYKVKVTDGNGCTSNISTGQVAITVNAIPVATITPQGSTTISATGTVKLKAAPTGTGYTFQWYLNGSPISGATGKEYIANQGGDYTVEVTKAGCTGMSGVQEVIQTGVKEEEGTTSSPVATGEAASVFELSAFPNPVSGILNVNVRGIEEVDAVLHVMDMNGKLVTVKEMKEVSATVDMTGYASGMYLIRYKDNQGRTGTIKVNKQ